MLVIKMADQLFTLSPPLCFSVNRINKIEIKVLKAALTDFYNQDEISAAKIQLIEDSDKVDLPGKPRLPKRQEGENRKAREIDDIVSLLLFLDEQKVIDSLPTYVSNSPDRMPYLRIVDGDLRFLIEKINNLEDTVRSLQETIASQSQLKPHVVSLPPVQQTMSRQTQQSSQLLQAGTSWADQLQSAVHSVHESSTPDWARKGGDARFFRTGDRYVNGQFVENVADVETDDAGEFQEVRRRKRIKPSSSPGTQNRVASRKQRPMKVVGKLQTDSKIKASDNVIDKAVFCVSNVCPGYSCDDLRSFLTDNDIQVVSCFDSKTRFVGTKSFRVCIAAKDIDRFEQPEMWPENVIVRNWFFKGKPNPNNDVRSE